SDGLKSPFLAVKCQKSVPVAKCAEIRSVLHEPVEGIGVPCVKNWRALRSGLVDVGAVSQQEGCALQTSSRWPPSAQWLNTPCPPQSPRRPSAPADTARARCHCCKQ